MCYLLKFAKVVLAVTCLVTVVHGLAEMAYGTNARAAEVAAHPHREATAMSRSDFKLNQIGVLMLGVTDLARSTAFYRDTLGLQPQGEVPGEFAFFKAGEVMLALSAPHADPKTSPHVVGAMEVVFSVEDVTAAYDALKSRGVTFVRAPRHATGVNWSAVFTDPDGHRLSLFGPKGGA